MIITNTTAYHCFCITMTLCKHRVGSPQKISFRSSQPFRFKGFLLSRSCCFYAWCSVAYFLAVKGVSTMTGKRNFEAQQSPTSTFSWYSRNFLCHASSSSTVHHNTLYCNTLHYNAMERRGRSYCWRSEMSGMNYNWITTENFFSFIATV